jgi:soluble lytic murein transglycosylase-like protein
MMSHRHFALVAGAVAVAAVCSTAVGNAQSSDPAQSTAPRKTVASPKVRAEAARHPAAAHVHEKLSRRTPPAAPEKTAAAAKVRAEAAARHAAAIAAVHERLAQKPAPHLPAHRVVAASSKIDPAKAAVAERKITSAKSEENSKNRIVTHANNAAADPFAAAEVKFGVGTANLGTPRASAGPAQPPVADADAPTQSGDNGAPLQPATAEKADSTFVVAAISPAADPSESEARNLGEPPRAGQTKLDDASLAFQDYSSSLAAAKQYLSLSDRTPIAPKEHLPYLALYAYSELPPPRKPADLALDELRGVPVGTPIQEIKRAADAFGLDFTFMKAVAKIESDFNPRQRTGSYIGLFQLSHYEFEKYGSGEITNPRDNAIAAAYKFVNEGLMFELDTHKDPTFSDLYLIHQQGWQGAAEHVAHPERIAWKSMCATDEGKEKGEKWCKRAIWQNTLPDIKHLWKSVDNLTSSAFVTMWRTRVEALYSRFAPTKHAATN